MKKLIINNLYPKNQYKFVLRGTVFEEEGTSSSFDINPPPGIPLLSKRDIKLDVSPRAGESFVGDNKTFNFSGFAKIPLDATYDTLRLRLRGGKNRGDLQKNDWVKFVSPESYFDNIDGRRYLVLKSYQSQTGKTWIVDIRVPKILIENVPSIGNTNPDNSYVVEVEKILKKSSFTITLPQQNIFDNLLNYSNIKDIPIYAFKNYDKTKVNGRQVPRHLLYGDLVNGNNPSVVVNEKVPPDYLTNQAMLNAFSAGPAYSKTLYTYREPDFVFYVAIARYTKENNVWSKEWLQVNKDNKAIWGVAKTNVNQ